jgi:hypothetical protein
MAQDSKKVDPFKTRKSKAVQEKGADTLTPPAEIAQAIDSFRECQEQAKHFEGEATIYKDKVLAYCKEEYTKRHLKGQGGSFKVLGDETMVNYVIQDSSAGLTDEDVAEFAGRFGEEAAEELITRDFRSIRFDPKVLAANYDQVVQALQCLPPEVLSQLFKPMLMMAKPMAMENGKKFAKTTEDLAALMESLKIKNYIR